MTDNVYENKIAQKLLHIKQMKLQSDLNIHLYKQKYSREFTEEEKEQNLIDLLKWNFNKFFDSLEKDHSEYISREVIPKLKNNVKKCEEDLFSIRPD